MTLSGRTLQVIPHRLIVQILAFGRVLERDIDSTFVLTFWPLKSGARIERAHANVADSDFAGISEGGCKYYWIPWRTYLQD